MKFTFNPSGSGIICTLIGIGGGIFALWQANKTNETCKKLGTAMEEVTKKTTVEVGQDIVNRAVEKAVDRDVKIAVSDTAEKVRATIGSEINGQVRKEVSDNLDAIKEAVSQKAQELVENIDEEEFGKRIEKEGAKLMEKKFKGSMENILSEFKNQLRTMTTTWKAAAEVFEPFRNNGGNYRI